MRENPRVSSIDFSSNSNPANNSLPQINHINHIEQNNLVNNMMSKKPSLLSGYHNPFSGTER